MSLALPISIHPHTSSSSSSSIQRTKRKINRSSLLFSSPLSADSSCKQITPSHSHLTRSPSMLLFTNFTEHCQRRLVANNEDISTTSNDVTNIYQMGVKTSTTIERNQAKSEHPSFVLPRRDATRSIESKLSFPCLRHSFRCVFLSA